MNKNTVFTDLFSFVIIIYIFHANTLFSLDLIFLMKEYARAKKKKKILHYEVQILIN